MYAYGRVSRLHFRHAEECFDSGLVTERAQRGVLPAPCPSRVACLRTTADACQDEAQQHVSGIHEPSNPLLDLLGSYFLLLECGPGQQAPVLCWSRFPVLEVTAGRFIFEKRHNSGSPSIAAVQYSAALLVGRVVQP